LLMEVVVFHYHFHLLSSSSPVTTGSRVGNSVETRSRTCSENRLRSGKCCGSSLGLAHPSALRLVELCHARKNVKSNVNLIVMKNEPSGSNNISKTNMH
jgi:hypothetical protein